MSRQPAIVILAGQIQKVGDEWQTEEGEGPGDTVGPTYAAFRVAAGAYLAQEHPDAVVITSGAILTEGAPSIASIVKKELVTYGVAASRIILFDQTKKTFQELQSLQKLDTTYSPIYIVTNVWHIPRVEAMLKDFPVRGVQVVAAEDTLLKHNPAQWRDRVERMKLDSRMAERHLSEQKGIDAIHAGQYRYTEPL